MSDLRSRGKPIAITLQDAAAIAALARLRAQHGSERAAIEAALRSHG